MYAIQHGLPEDLALELIQLTLIFRKPLMGLCYAPQVIVTDKLKSYGAAKRDFLPGVEHCQHTSLNDRAELSHQPTRKKERQM